tara:strand:- start:143 stop:244 length:102 start_codon:yes stop_codon:yes gene_type:complete
VFVVGWVALSAYGLNKIINDKKDIFLLRDARMG